MRDWLLGLVAAVAVIGPGLGSGSLLSLDLVFTPTMAVPSGMWGLGPELPRRVPLGAVLGWLSPLIGGATAGKLLLVAAIAGAVAGTSRLARSWGSSALAATGAGLLYGVGPFALTRLGAGQWGLLAATAVLPWTVPTLLRPAVRAPATFLAAAALALTGFVGGAFSVIVAVVGLVVERPAWRRAATITVAVVVAQLPWLVPAVVVTVTSPDLRPAAGFSTSADGLWGWLGVVIGHGFWRRSNDVGLDGVGGAAIGLMVLLAAAAGRSRIPARWRAAASGLAALGAAIAVASAIPGVRSIYAELTGWAGGAPFRESHRALPLLLVGLFPAAALGADRAGRWLGSRVRALPATLLVAAAVALAQPVLWGLDGRLDPVDFPHGYAAAAREIERRPGPVVALPWHQYLDLSFADGRRVLNPLPDYLGGDVITSADPELGAPRREDADRRGVVLDRAVSASASGAPDAATLARVGVRWVVLLEEVEWRTVLADLERDPGLTAVEVGEGVRLFAVDGWRGPVVDGSGRSRRIDPVVAPLQRVQGAESGIWARSGASGWLRGVRAVDVTSDGLLALPGGSGSLWYWPSLLVLGGDLLCVAFALFAVRSLSSSRT